VKKRKETLLSALQNPDWRARMQSIDELTEIEDEALAEALVEIVKEHHRDLNALNAALSLLSLPGRSFFPGVAALLENEDPEIRLYSAITLGMIGDNRAVPLLLTALNDPDMNVRFAAIESLGGLEAQEAVDRLIEILQEKDYFLLFPVIQSLERIGDSKPVPYLMNFVKDEGLADVALTALGALAGEEAVPTAAEYLDMSGSDAGIAATALVSIYSRSENSQQVQNTILAHLTAQRRAALASFALTGAPEISSPQEQYHFTNVAVLLGWLLEAFPNEKLACKALVQLLDLPYARRHALENLKGCSDLIIPSLVEALEDPDQDIRYSAMQLFVEKARKDDVPVLEKVLQSEQPELVALAAEGLARLGEQSVYELLKEKLNSPFAHVRQAILRSMEALDHPDHTRQMLELIEDPNPVLREIGIISLSRLQKHEHSARILAALADPAENVRRAAVQALPVLGDPQAFDTLEEVSRGEDAGMRIAAVKALASCPAEFAVPLLHTALEDMDYWVRIHACRSLAQFGRPESYPYMAELIRDPMPPVRVAALDALSESGSESALEAVLPFIEDENIDVRRAAQRAIEHLRQQAGKIQDE
jgi:HEAT repeat protein